MAANDYYNNHSSPYGHEEPHTYGDPTPPPPPPSSSKPYPISTSTSSTSIPYHDYGRNQYNGSHQTLGSDFGYYGNGAQGGLHENDQYADNIPLKSNAQKVPGQDDWLAQNTQYPPSPEAQRPPPLDDRKRRRAAGWFSGKIPWFVYFVTLVQISVFIAEIVKNASLTHSPIEVHPQFNPMIGPSPYVLINMGARFVPCMRNTHGIQDANQTIPWSCPNTTSSDATNPSNNCQLSDLCGFSGVPNPVLGKGLNQSPEPNQWYRFIIPMFLHAGIIHISFNLLLQLTMGREMELIIGSIRFGLVYLSSGIFGFVMGGNFAPPAIASTGASGCLFGILALTLLDLIYSWGERRNPVSDLMFILLDVVISFVLGLLPGLDNFSHIGGFLMGLVLGVCILRSPNVLRERIGLPPTPYQPMMSGARTDMADDTGGKAFTKAPIGFFKGRKPAWWVWWLIRAAALVGVFVAFIVLLNNFYKYRTECSWCKHLSCLPIKNWCSIGEIPGT